MTATMHPGRSIQRSVVPSLAAAPNYALRRCVALVLVVALLAVAVMALAGVVGVLVDFGGRPAAASEIAPSTASGNPATLVRIHVAQAGDTLWSIAEAHRGDVARDRFVDALIDLNGGTAIEIGQAVHLP